MAKEIAPSPHIPSQTKEERMQGIRDWLAAHFLEEYFDDIVEQLGAKCVEDIELIKEQDLAAIGCKVLDARRLITAARGERARL